MDKELNIKELTHVMLLKELRDAKAVLPILEVASLIREIYKQEELEILAKELVKHYE